MQVEAELLEEVQREKKRPLPSQEDQVPWIGELRGNSWIRHVHFFPIAGDEAEQLEWERRFDQGKTLVSDAGMFVALVFDRGLVIVLAFVGAGMHEQLKDEVFQRSLAREAEEFIKTLS